MPYLWVNYWRGDGGRSESLNLSPELDLKVSSRFSTSLSLNLSRNRDNTQWFGNLEDSTTGQVHYTFAHLSQKTASLTWRMNFTFTPTMSLQLYAQPFVSKGTYTDVRELAQPRAARYGDRFQAYGDTAVTNNPGGFNVQAFRSNVVFRWEYRPGSSIFLVWSQGRQGFAPVEGNRSLSRDLSDVFSLRADDSFLVKVSYWLNW